MAEKVIIDIEIDGTKSIDTINKLNEEIKTQKELLNDAKIGSEEYVNANEAINKLTKAHKELTTELTKEEKIRQKQAAAMEKEAQKMQELIKAASMEVKSEEDMIKKKNALIALRKKVDQTTEEGAKKYREMGNEILELNNQLIKNDEAINMHQRKVGNYTGAIKTVNMSLGEMKLALRELRNVSFADKTEEEVIALREQMARLTEGIRDFQEQNAAASESGIPAFVAGLQGIVASVQLVTGTLASFGIENERLEKSMVQLIGVAQALATVEDIYARGKFKVMLTTIKDTAAKVENAAAAKGQALATTGATAATRALGKAMMSNPYLVMAAAATALISGTIVLIKYLKEQGSIQNEINEANEAAAKDIGTQKQDLNSLLNIAKDHSKSLRERQDAMDEINKLSPEYLGNLTLETINTKSAADAINLYTQEISKKAKAKALESILTEKYIKLEKQYASGAQIQKISDTKDEIAALERKLADLTQTTSIFTNVTAGATQTFTDLIGTSQLGVPEGTKAVNYDGAPIEYKGGKWVAVVVTPPSTNEFNNSLKQINKEYELNLFFAKDRIAQFEAEKTKAQALFDLYKTFYAEGGYTGQELEKLEQLKNTIEQISSLMSQIPVERAEALRISNEQLITAMDAEMSQYIEMLNIQEELRKDQQERQDRADEEAIEKQKEKWMQYSTLASDAMGTVGEIIGESINETGFDLENFSKKIVLLGLDVLEKQALLAIASSTTQALAQPDSVATFGATGVARAAVLTGLIKAALAVTKAAVSGFAEGGFTGHGGKYEPAGTVHKGEVVFSQADVAALGGAQTVDAMRPTSKQNYYVGGIVGSVPQPVNSSAMLLDAIRQIRPVVTVQDINAVAQAEANRQQIAVI